MVALRQWDDAAKVPGIETSTPRAMSYRHLVIAHLERQASNPVRCPLPLFYMGFLLCSCWPAD